MKFVPTILHVFSKAPKDMTVTKVLGEKLDVDAETTVYVSITCTALPYRTDSKISRNWLFRICCAHCKKS